MSRKLQLMLDIFLTYLFFEMSGEQSFPCSDPLEECCWIDRRRRQVEAVLGAGWTTQPPVYQ